MKIKLKNNKIKIMQITDTHIGNLPYHEDDHKTFALIDKMISQEKPDLIIHTGDIMWSDGVKKIEEIFPYVMERFDAHKIPMAITFGNHEAESYVSKAEFRNFFEEKVEMRADKHHVFNENDKECYVIEVLNENDEV